MFDENHLLKLHISVKLGQLFELFFSSANVSGTVINTCGWVRAGGYKSIVHAAGAFEGNCEFLLKKHYNKVFVELAIPQFLQTVI